MHYFYLYRNPKFIEKMAHAVATADQVWQVAFPHAQSASSETIVNDSQVTVISHVLIVIRCVKSRLAKLEMHHLELS